MFGEFRWFRQYFTPSQLWSLYRGLICPCLEYSSHACTTPLDRVESKALCLINSPSLTDSLQILSLNLSYVFITLVIHLQNSINECFLPSGGHTTLAKQSNLTLFLSNYVMQNLTSSDQLWNKLPSSVFPPTYGCSSFKRNVSWHLELNCTWFWTPSTMCFHRWGHWRALTFCFHNSLHRKNLNIFYLSFLLTTI